MSYKNAEKVLPKDLLNLLQNYVDGECIYIPRKESNKKTWGSKTLIRKELALRNCNIFEDYLSGLKTDELAYKYYLSQKSIQRIITQEKKFNSLSEPCEN